MSLDIFAVFFGQYKVYRHVLLAVHGCQALGIWDPPNPCSHISIIYFAISGIIWLTYVGAERGHNKWGGGVMNLMSPPSTDTLIQVNIILLFYCCC